MSFPWIANIIYVTHVKDDVSEAVGSDIKWLKLISYDLDHFNNFYSM